MAGKNTRFADWSQTTNANMFYQQFSSLTYPTKQN